MTKQPHEFITLGEAQQRLGVSRFKVRQLVKEGKLPVFQSERDRREKLVRVRDVDAVAQPRAITEQKEEAAA